MRIRLNGLQNFFENEKIWIESSLNLSLIKLEKNFLFQFVWVLFQTPHQVLWGVRGRVVFDAPLNHFQHHRNQIESLFRRRVNDLLSIQGIIRLGD